MNMSTNETLYATGEYTLADNSATTAGGDPERSNALTVLLVEDNDADVYLIKRALAGNPRVAKVVLAQDGVEALELIDSHAVKPDLAIIDLHMPRKDGFSLLLEMGLRPTVSFPSVVLTSSRLGADARRAASRGAEAYFVKPNSIGKLTALMDGVISVI